VVEPLESEETLVTKMRLAWRKGRNWLRYTRTRDPSDTHTTTTTTVVEETQRGKPRGRHQFLFETKKPKTLFCICLLSQNCSYRPFFCARTYLKNKQTNNINWRDFKTLSDMFYRLCIMLSVFPLKNPSPALVKEMALIRRWDRLIVEPLPLHDYMNE
jgi:hypothetical protein